MCFLILNVLVYILYVYGLGKYFIYIFRVKNYILKLVLLVCYVIYWFLFVVGYLLYVKNGIKICNKYILVFVLLILF